MRIRDLVAAVMLALLPAPAFAGTLTGGATLPEQIVQEATSIEKLAKQVQSVETEIAQYENMIQNMTTLPQSMIGQIMQPIDQLYGLVGQAQQLGTNAMNLSNQFQSMNATFNPQITEGYTTNYESITQGLNNAINTALQAANLNPSNFTTQAQAEQAIANALANPNSRNALLQGAVAAGQATVSSLTQMEQTANDEATMEASWRKAQLTDQTQQTADNQAINQAMYGTPGQTDNSVQTSGGTMNALTRALNSNP